MTTLTAKQLKMKIPEVVGVGIHTIQSHCCHSLELTTRKLPKKPILNQRMAFAEEYRKRIMFADKSF